MERLPRKIYTYEFKLAEARLVESGESIAGAAHSLNIPEQTLWRWVQDRKAGKLRSSGRGSKLTTEQMGIRQLRADLARVKMERDTFHPADRSSSVGWSTPARTTPRS